MPLLALTVALLMGASVVMIFAGLAIPAGPDQVQQRLTRYGTRPRTLEEIELERPFSERVVTPVIRSIARFITRFAPQRNIENIRYKLELAGNPNNWQPSDFLGVRGLSALICTILPLLLFLVARAPLLNTIMFSGLFGLLGFFLPAAWLGRKISARQKEIVKALPDALDLLSISVEAGLGFDAAMSRVSEKWDNELSRAFGQVIRRIRVGKTRQDALRDMANSMNVPDVTNFVAAVIQADQLGVSIAKVLHIQSEQMRIKRRQRAEEEAQKAPVKMVFPLVLLELPSLFIVLLGPAVPRVLRTLGIELF
ncbi:MAG: type II secretion system F family protein [Anaerolineae bacterium]